jgi:hypothetical protein
MARIRREEEDRNEIWREQQVQEQLENLTDTGGGYSEGILQIMARLRVQRSRTFRRFVDAELQRLVNAEFERIRRYAEKALRQNYGERSPAD